MQFIPWRYIADWKCTSCGMCCRFYSVVLSFPEWLHIVQRYGVEHTASGLDKLFIRRRSDGSCAFLSDFSNASACELQSTKPRACKIWPFKVQVKPEFGYAHQAAYQIDQSELFIYADPACHGLTYGHPTWEFANFTLKEFVQIAMGIRETQCKTTGAIPSYANLGIIGSLRKHI